MITLRKHQQDAHDAVLDHLKSGGRNALVNVCVGGGKSMIQAAIAKTVFDNYPGAQILGLTMTKELIRQNAEESLLYWPQMPVGINCSGLKKRNTTNPLIFGHPLSVRSQIKALGKRHILMIDEVHNVSRKDEAVYGKMIAALRIAVPDLVCIGFTGTMWRLDTGRLDEPWRGVPSMWDKVVFNYGILDGIRDGFLVPPITREPGITLDVSGVKLRGGEFIESQLQAAVDVDDMNQRIADNLLINMSGRKRCLVFCTGVKHAEHMRDALKARGASALLVTGDTDDNERDAAFDYFKRGAAQYLVNVGVATTGFNDPGCDAVAILRPSQSSGLITQMVGRCIRAAPQKTDGLVLDYGGNFERLGCIDQMDGKKYAGVAGGKPPTKVCPDCQTRLPASVLKCTTCGHEWERAGPDLATQAISVPVVSIHQGSVWKDVSTVHYELHQKRDQKGDPIDKPSLKIVYLCGVTPIYEWLAFESAKPGGIFVAQMKWRARCITDVMPLTALEAVTLAKDNLRRPGRIQVKKDGKYWSVLTVDMSVPPLRERDTLGFGT